MVKRGSVLAGLTFAMLAYPIASTLAQKPYAGTASGNLMVDGKSIPLRYAYVIEVDNVEEAGLLLQGPQKCQILVLSDRKLPLKSVENRNTPYAERHSPGEIMQPLKKSEADQMYGILLKLELPKNVPLLAQLFYPGKDSFSMSVAGTEYPDRVTALKRANGWLSGTAFLPTAQATGLEKGPKKYQYRVTFRAPILSEPPVKAKWEGKQALESPPVQALRAYLTAAQKGDVEALRGLTAETHQSYLKNPEVLKFLQSADVKELEEQVKRVVVRGDAATITLVNEKPTYSQVNMQLTREKGVWKLYWP